MLSIDPEFIQNVCGTAEKRPYQYRGWLLYYILLVHQYGSQQHPTIVDRWGYTLKILETRKLPEEPIPQIQWLDHPHPEVEKMLDSCMQCLYEHGYVGEARMKLMEWIGYGCSLLEKESTLPTSIQEALYKKLDVGLWIQHPYDYLGRVLSEAKQGKWCNPTAFFPTPHAVVDAMTQIVMHDSGDMRLKSVLDCCCGTGRMLLHASNHSLLLYGNDIDWMMVLATKINGALYVPWLLVSLDFLKQPIREEKEG